MLPAMRLGSRLVLAALGVCSALACVGPELRARGHYESPNLPAADPQPSGLLSAHVSSYGEPGGYDDALILVFARELDPLGVVPEAFGIMRADGKRVRPVDARLAADEGDENRSVILRGAFGEPDLEPLAVHVLGSLFSEQGESFEGLDLAITPASSPNHLVLVERLDVAASRCPSASQVVRTHWSDLIAGVGEADLAAIELGLADGTSRAPVGFDDQAAREDEGPAAPGPGDDNVLDLCVDVAAPIVRLRVAAGLFTDAQGHASAAAEATLPAG